jgi:hypothetical protein
MAATMTMGSGMARLLILEAKTLPDNGDLFEQRQTLPHLIMKGQAALPFFGQKQHPGPGRWVSSRIP